MLELDVSFSKMIPFIEIDERLKTKKMIAFRLFGQSTMRQVKLLRGSELINGSLAEQHGDILVIIVTLDLVNLGILGSSYRNTSSGKDHGVEVRSEGVVASTSACWAVPDVSDELTVEVDGVVVVEVATLGTAGSEVARVPVEGVSADAADVGIRVALLIELPGAGLLDVCNHLVALFPFCYNAAQSLHSDILLEAAISGNQIDGPVKSEFDKKLT